MRKLIPLLLCVAIFPAHADERTEARDDALIATVLEKFWDNARDPKGRPIQPNPSLDRHTVPIPASVAYQAIDAGEAAGRASRCLIRFMPQYRAIAASAQQQGMSATQVAFISALYGEKLMQVARSKVRCTAGDQRLAENKLEASMRAGLTFP